MSPISLNDAIAFARKRAATEHGRAGTGASGILAVLVAEIDQLRARPIPDLAKLLDLLDELDASYVRRYGDQYGSYAQVSTSAVRALLGTDTTPEAHT